MTSIVDSPADPWPGFVAQALEWGRLHRVEWRDAVFLVPTAQHLPLARRAWAGAGCWMPRVETTLTLARALAPPAAAGPATGLSFDVSADRLAAAALLDGQAWAAAWARRDAVGWAQALDAMVATAHAFWHAAAAVAPAARDDWWLRGRAWLAATAARALQDGPGGAERALARLAFEWVQLAMATTPPPTDSLFGLAPAAWVDVKAGGADPLTVRLLAAAAAAGTPCLTIDADPAPDRPFHPVAAAPPLHVGVCGDFEDEAQRAAAQVLADLAAAAAATPPVRLPVALVSLDRRLVRRIRALLARRGVVIADETGWTLSTTRAAASLMGLLAALQPQATGDELLNGLQACADGWPGIGAGRAGLATLDAAARRHGWHRAAAVDPARLSPAAAALWRACRQAAERFAEGDDRRTALAGWMDRLRALLGESGLGVRLGADEAGRQVLAALDDSAALVLPLAGAVAGPAASMTRTQFVDWIDRVLEAATYVPPAPAAPQVVITPLQRAPLRPFAAIVLPGADDRHLGNPPPRPQLLSDAEAAGFGLPDGAARRERETLAFAQLLRGAAPLTVLHRRDDAVEPLAASPLLARALLARTQAGVGWAEAADHRVEVPAGVRPVARPLPVAPALLPARISASGCEALRACPYRFFALRVLGLQESPELDDAVEKRDYGSWLHAVLHRFHVERAALPDGVGSGSAAPADAAALRAIADQLLREGGLDAASFLPYRAGFERFVPRYVDWLHEREAGGARWLDGEREFSVAPAEWGGTLMHGVIDRLDGVDGRDGPLTELIDYKTGAAQTLRQALKRPQEDTQLAFYAGLLMTQSAAVGGAGELAAMYLALDEADGLRELPHADVESTARQLIAGIGTDLARLREGAAMPALGEGRACDFCDARGLCRRDQWAPA